jgi:hypothetical protein
MMEHTNIKIFSLLTVEQFQILVSFMSIKDGKNITESNSASEEASSHNFDTRTTQQYYS